MKKNYDFLTKLMIYLVIVILSLNFVPTGDDYYFFNTGFESLIDAVFFNSNNGRYLGNFSGVFVSNLSKFDILQYIKPMIMGTGIFLVILLCSKLSNIKAKSAVLLSTLFILIAPSSIYREVYSWTPGYMNYLMPVLLILLILNILKKYMQTDQDVSVRDIFFIVILGICCQLFMEHIT